jgi:adenylate kinase family enzyme
MQRIAVVGTSCSGKTTLARRIAETFEIKHIELDALYWQPNWTPLAKQAFRQLVEAEAAQDAWVIDGNYSVVRDIIWSRAKFLVWLDLPFLTVLWRAISRTLKRIATREELFSGNRETLKLALLDRDGIPYWVIRTHHRRRREYADLIAEGRYPQLEILKVRSSKDARQLLPNITERHDALRREAT